MNGQEWCRRCGKPVMVETNCQQVFLDVIETTTCTECHATISKTVRTAKE